MSQNHPVLENGRTLLPYPGFDIFAETEFDSVESMTAAFAGQHYRSSVTADEHELIDRERFSLAVCERQVRVAGDPGGDSVKLITILRTHPARSPAAFLEAFTGPYAQAVARTGPSRHEQLVPVDALEAAVDAVDEIWFASPRDAIRHLGSAAGDEAARELGGLALGCERVIVRPRLVFGPRLPAG